MKVTKIRDDVWKFKGSSSVYLIRDSKWILIDAGDAMDKDDFVREIKKIVALDKVDVILLTHLHYDHLGILDLFSNAEIFVSEEELGDYLKDAKGFHFYVDEEVDAILRKRAKIFPGENLFGLKILKVPGHTRGSVAFLDEKRKLLFTGDTIFGGGIQGRIDLPNSVPEKMDESVRMLREMISSEGLGICPGHGYWEDRQNL